MPKHSDKYIPKQEYLQNCSSQPSRHLGYIILHAPHLATSLFIVQFSRAIWRDIEKFLKSSSVSRSYSLLVFDVYGMISLHWSGAGLHFSLLENCHAWLDTVFALNGLILYCWWKCLHTVYRAPTRFITKRL